MRERKILFTDNGWRLVQQEAKEQGVSAAQFVREAALAYVVWSLSRRRGEDISEVLERVLERLRSE